MAGKDRGKPISVETFNCPNCGAGVEVLAPGQSLSVVCKACASIIDAAHPNHKILSTFSLKVKHSPVIPLGSKGRIKGSLWQVIGFMVRTDGPGDFQWQEYLLFNPMKGFRWLMEAEGHWNFIKTTHTQPVGKSKWGREGTRYLGKYFYLFHRGTAKVKFVLGEFYWRVRVGDSTKVEDYICPPEILSMERSDKEIIWSIGEYLEADTVKKAFSLQKFPWSKGVAPNQPSPANTRLKSIRAACLFFICLLFSIQILTHAASPNHQVYSEKYAIPQQVVPAVKVDKRFYDVVTPSFQLESGLSNVEMTLHCPVHNNWLAMTAELVNDKTDEVYGFDIGVEFYSGRDSDGAWTEGSQTEYITLSAIPEGTYHLNIKVERNPKLKPITLYTFTVKRGVPLWSNFWIAALFIVVPWLIAEFRAYSFEIKRWENSDYSPYHGAE